MGANAFPRVIHMFGYEVYDRGLTTFDEQATSIPLQKTMSKSIVHLHMNAHIKPFQNRCRKACPRCPFMIHKAEILW